MWKAFADGNIVKQSWILFEILLRKCRHSLPTPRLAYSVLILNKFLYLHRQMDRRSAYKREWERKRVEKNVSETVKTYDFHKRTEREGPKNAINTHTCTTNIYFTD